MFEGTTKRTEAGKHFVTVMCEEKNQSVYMYLFAIDLERNVLIWLNILVDGMDKTCEKSHEFLLPYLRMQTVVNLHDFFCLLATEVVDDPISADVLVTDQQLPHRDDAQILHSYDSEKILALMNAQPGSGQVH